MAPTRPDECPLYDERGYNATSPPTWRATATSSGSATVREFISEIRGLSGSAVQRKVLEEVVARMSPWRRSLGVEKVNRTGIAKLLARCASTLGRSRRNFSAFIGENHFKALFLASGGNAGHV